MELIYFVNLTFIFVVNIVFFFSGIFLNSLVILSFWRCVQLQKKMCYFTITVLSCCDLLVALTSHPLTALAAILWLSEKTKVSPWWLVIFQAMADIFVGLSLLALLVMSFDRYLSTYYPVFHRISVTKRKLLTFFACLVSVEITVAVTSINDLVISYQVGILIFCVMFIPPMVFLNYKLFTAAGKMRRNNRISPEMKNFFSLKRSISSCLLVVACLIVLSIPTFAYIGLRLTSKEKEDTLDNATIAGFWTKTTGSMNSTFNCLIFYWKNKTLRGEGMKVIKGMKICRKGNLP